MVEMAQPFFARWGVLPPQTGELLDADPRRRLVEAIASGRWGIVPVFQWTKNHEIRERVRKIRSVIGKQHRDALILRDEQLMGWLEACGFHRPAIARAVSGRQTGLRRPTKAQAIARTSEDHERQLYEEYRNRGLTEAKIEQQVYKRLRGSEAPASAAVRMGERRYIDRTERLNEALATPIQSEPLSEALTVLFRALLHDEDDATVKRRAGAVSNAFVGASGPPARIGQRIAVPSEQPPLEALVSDRWGIVLVFPWTTEPDIRASIKKLRTMVQPQPQDGSGPAPAARPIQFEPLSDALIPLFRAVANQDDAAVRRYALEARAAFLRAGAS